MKPKGLREDNLIVNDGKSPCKHLRGSKPGKYSCAVHNYLWYKKTPCYDFTQVEPNKETPCRIGEYILRKIKDGPFT